LSRNHRWTPAGQLYTNSGSLRFINTSKSIDNDEAGNNRHIDITGQGSFPKEVAGPNGLPSRAEQIRRLRAYGKSKDPIYDVLIIGGGATGAGCALDAAHRGLKVACIERGDFASETSSRSTKLIWAGIRYLATASASLLSTNLFKHPIQTLMEFKEEFHMVVNCHRERRYMTHKQRHLCNWMPIAVPFDKWFVTPAPFGHWLFSFFPILAPFVFKFYDGLSKFTCPPSYVMGPTRSNQTFPQLSNRGLRYCAVFYEAMHNDARTNLAIALSAAEQGADIANYVEMVDVLLDPQTKRAIGIKAKDRMTGSFFLIYAKTIIFAGGPFTDSLRMLEAEKLTDVSVQVTSPSNENPTKVAINKAVAASSGTHIVLPGYYCPDNMGLLDYNTSDGRFLFFLPWEGHTLVGTTDTKCKAESLPTAPEEEIQWILKECGKYISPELSVRRSDVLSAWRGWRPLAVDPHAPPGAPVSRDHVMSVHPITGIHFIAGGKWTTWREMAQDMIDKITNKPCRTLELTLYGGKGYSPNLSIQLIQRHGMSQTVAEHLARTYGGRAMEVCELSKPTNQQWPRFGNALAPNYPYIDAEVSFACREYACTIEDVLSRRTRLAFLNKDAALAALPRVADIMAKELGWSSKIKEEQIIAAELYLESYGGRIPNKAASHLRNATYTSVRDIFNAIDMDGTGYLDRTEVGEIAAILGLPLSEEQLTAAFHKMDQASEDGRVSIEEFEAWWREHEHKNMTSSSIDDNKELQAVLAKTLRIGGKTKQDIKEIGPGTLLG